MSLTWERRDVLLFALSVVLLLAGHVIRATRLTALYPRNSAVRRFDLLLALALGYCVNTFIPGRLGEVVRTLYVGKRCQIRYAYVAATVAGERLSDVLFLGVAFGLLYATGNLPHTMLKLVLTFLAASAAGVFFALLVKDSRSTRHGLWKAASLFNATICYGILDLVWSYSEIVTGRLMLRSRFLLLTVLMWSFYGFSYLVFGFAAHARIVTVMYEMLGLPLHSMLERTLQGRLAGEEILLLGFAVVPVLLILGFGLLRDQNSLVRVWTSLLHGRFKTWDQNPSPISEHFKEHSEYKYFLTSLFAGEDQSVSGFGLSAIEDGVVHRIFNGGSGAITALVEVDGELMIRKFAIGDLKDKLKVQVDWLEMHKAELPVVEILAERRDPSFYRYDMFYPAQVNDFYDFIHTAPLEQSSNILMDVIQTVHQFHENTARGDVDDLLLDRYLEQKVIRNSEVILNFISDVIQGQHYRLNGQDYTLEDWRRIQDPAWLRRQVHDRRMTRVHGDLTIENIIISPTHERGWYLIDPNPDNVFDTPYIDWAKLRQSLHLGYEGLNKSATCTWRNSELSLALTRSHAYNQLNARYEALLDQQMGPGAHREVRFHELVNYLRLTPYKIRQNPTKGLTFFACTSILLASYLKEYD